MSTVSDPPRAALVAPEWRALIDNFPGWLAILDGRGRFLAAPRDARTPQTASSVGRKAVSFLESRFHAAFRKALAGVYSNGRPATIEVRYRGKSPGERWYELRLGPLRDKGRVAAVLLAASDITERKRTEERLRASEGRLKEAQSIAHVGNFERDLKTGSVTWSDETYRIFGIAPGKAVSYAAILRRILPDDRDVVRLSLARAVKTRGWFEHDLRIRSADGLIHHLHASGRVLSDDNGRPSRLLGAVQDVTDRAHFLETLRDTWVVLKTLIRSSPLAILACDTSGRVTVWNPAAERLFGWSEEAVLGLFPPPLSGGRPAGALLEEVLAGGPAGQRELRCRRRDGGSVDVGIWASPLEDEKGKRLGLLGMFLDVTERNRLEWEVAEISERERRRVGRDLHDGLGQLLSGVGLSSKALERKLSARDPALAQEAQKVTRAIGQAVGRVRDVSHLLFPEELERSGLRSALRSLADDSAASSGLAFSFRAEGSSREPDQETAIQLFRIAQEAVHNALKHGRCRKVTLGLAVDRRQTVLTVADDGLGLRRGRRRQRGIGLRLMAHRASLIGATLNLDSGPGRGTTVRCAAPLQAPPRSPR